MRKLIVISIDALTDEDIRKAQFTPNICRLMESGSYVKAINGIYPSLTHPCHATIFTGKTPGVHGIIANKEYSKDGRPWFNTLTDLKCPSVIDHFKRHGATVACCRWPVTAGGFDKIDYLIPEITSTKEISEDCLARYLAISSPNLHGIIRKNIGMLNLKSQPEEDLFSTACVCDIIRTFQPDVLFTHPACVDSYKHHTGIDSEKTLEMVRIADAMVGDIIHAVEETGHMEQTTIVVLSDHGHMKVDREIALNEIFRRDGMYGKIVADECGHSAQIYLNGIEEREAYTYLLKKAEDPASGISEVLTKEELVRRYGTYGAFSFMVESDDRTQFSNEVGCDVEIQTTVDDHHGVSTHGHMPEKSPKPIFLAYGPGIAHKTIAEDSMLREAPTFLKIMGIEEAGYEKPLDIFS